MQEIIELNWPSILRRPEDFHQNQFSAPITGPVECVTTAILIARNMMNEFLAYKTGNARLPDISLKEYILGMDKLGWRGMVRRVPTNFPDITIPGTSHKINPRGFMLPRIQARIALKYLISDLRHYYGIAFFIQQTPGNTIQKISDHLRMGHIVLISGLYPPSGPEQEILRGNPHTLGPVVQIDYTRGTITCLDTGPERYKCFKIEEFIKFWGRKSLLNMYVRPYTMTTLIPESKDNGIRDKR